MQSVPIDDAADSPWYRVSDGSPSAEVPFLEAPASMGGLACEVCKRTWIAYGVHYPTIDPGILAWLPPPDPWPRVEFEAIAERVRRVAGRPGLWLPPAAAFGAYSGRLAARPNALVYAAATVLFAPAAWAAFDEAGVRLGVGVPGADLRFRGRSWPCVTVELSAVLRASPAHYPVLESCSACGYERRDFTMGQAMYGEPLWPRRPERPLLAPPALRLARASTPTDMDIARVREAAGSVVVSEGFRRVAQRIAPGALAFEQVVWV